MPEAFIVDAIRTPIGRFGGALAAVRPDDMLAHTMRTVMERNPSVDWDATDDVIMGAANQAGEDNRNVGRMAVLLSGMAAEVSGTTINRLCGSGMEAVGYAARSIKTGEADLILAGGVESMSRAPKVMAKAETAFSRTTEAYDTTIGWRFTNPRLEERFGKDEMPGTAENVAQEFAISRKDQDAFALRSQERTAAAVASGRLAAEIVPVEVPQRRGEPRVVASDEHPRPDSSIEKLAKLRPLFENGTITAGNASGINDGAATVLVASEQAVAKYDLSPRARIVGMATAGVPPRIMGIGPVPATNKLLARQAPGTPLYLGQLPGPIGALRQTAMNLGLLPYGGTPLLNKEWFIGREGFLIFHPFDRLVGHIFQEMIIGIIRQFNWGCPIVNEWCPNGIFTQLECYFSLIRRVINSPSLKNHNERG